MVNVFSLLQSDHRSSVGSIPNPRSITNNAKAASRAAKLETLRTIILTKSVVRDRHAGILAPDGTRHRWFFDLQSTLLDPNGLEIVAEAFWDCFNDRLPFQVGGIELGCVPLISAI